MVTFRQILRNVFTREEITSFILLEVVSGIIFSFLSLLIFLFITSAVTSRQTIFVDDQITSFILMFRAVWLTKVMLAISLLGSEAIIFSSAIIVTFLTIRKHRKETFIFSLLVIMGVIATTGLKLLYKIPRPELFPLVFENSYSYPSGHALNSFLFYSTVSYFIYHFTKNRHLSLTIFFFSMLLIAVIGLSRIYLGVHHPSDVFAGYTIGFWIFATVILVDKTVTFFRLIRENSQA